jgi:eukaryotic-like serine/threonine-protein kinase
MEGKVFKQRYQLTAKLGGGRLADAYVAEDLQMNRPVVVKVLYDAFTSDPAYVQSLEAETRVAADLVHPNITATLDWGREDEHYFVVTEYIKGRSLSEFMSSEGSFPQERAARIAADVCDALQLVHSRGLVHGGVSASNIFIDEIGQVKLMDVGMAWTASGRGTPQYVSPEQARGLAVDARSDIYSVGIVLYQMLAGSVPFDDPNAETIFYKQINEQPVAPSSIDPNIPPELNALVMKALVKNPSLRFQSARELHDALLRFSGSLPAPVAVAAPAPAAVAPPAQEKKPSRAWIWVAGVLGLLIIVGIVLAIVFLGGGGGTVTVPNLVGLSEDQARQSLQEVGLTLQTQDDYVTSEAQEVGVVSSQNPAAGATMEKGASVTAMVTAELRMPNVVGQTPSDAQSTLKNKGISTIVVTNTPVSDKTKVGTVVSQDPPGGTLIAANTSVTLEVGEEVKTVSVPDVVGMEQSKAETQLKNAGFQVEATEQADPTVPKGQVISQVPLAGKLADEGSTVNIIVSTGPPPT